MHETSLTRLVPSPSRLVLRIAIAPISFTVAPLRRERQRCRLRSSLRRSPSEREFEVTEAIVSAADETRAI